VEKPEKKDHLEDIGVDGTILKLKVRWRGMA
jgi:hypothetical protein